jgi:hypothetical protein
MKVSTKLFTDFGTCLIGVIGRAEVGGFSYVFENVILGLNIY